jgi:predicted RNase H-like HicB family nuclease
MSARRYPVVIEQTGTGYSAYSPDVSGCVAVGDTEDETRRNFQDALIAHFEAMREVGEPIPEPHSSVDYVEVAASPRASLPRCHGKPIRARMKFVPLTSP